MLDIFPKETDPNFKSEIWVPVTNDIISGVEPGYYISNWGRIYNSNTFNYYPGENVKREWYITVYFDLLTGDRMSVPLHRLVSYVFNFNSNYLNLEVNHIDGIKYHNWIWNLEWTTHKENMVHANETGLTKIGEDHGNAVVSNDQIFEMCELISKGYSPQDIQNILSPKIPGVDISAIVDSIKNGYAWKQIASKYDFSNMYHREFRFTEDQIHKICKIFENYGKEISYKSVLDKLGIDYSQMTKKELQTVNVCIYNLRHKKYFKEIVNKYNY